MMKLVCIITMLGVNGLTRNYSQHFLESQQLHITAWRTMSTQSHREGRIYALQNNNLNANEGDKISPFNCYNNYLTQTIRTLKGFYALAWLQVCGMPRQIKLRKSLHAYMHKSAAQKPRFRHRLETRAQLLVLPSKPPVGILHKVTYFLRLIYFRMWCSWLL